MRDVSWEEQLEREAAIGLCGDAITYEEGDATDGNEHPVAYVHVRWVTRQHQLRAQLEAFARDCVAHGDMTPAAARMLNRILAGEIEVTE